MAAMLLISSDAATAKNRYDTHIIVLLSLHTNVEPEREVRRLFGVKVPASSSENAIFEIWLQFFCS
jgi:hypothetical protein